MHVHAYGRHHGEFGSSAKEVLTVTIAAMRSTQQICKQGSLANRWLMIIGAADTATDHLVFLIFTAFHPKTLQPNDPVGVMAKTEAVLPAS